jgi:hypothetical protein
MPINILSGNSPQFAIATYLLGDAYDSSYNRVSVVRATPAGQHKYAGSIYLTRAISPSGVLDLDSTGVLIFSEAGVFVWGGTGTRMGSMVNAVGYTPYDANGVCDLYVTDLVSQHNPNVEAWSYINTPTPSPFSLTNAPKIVEAGVISQGTTSKFASFKFGVNSKWQIKFNTGEGYYTYIQPFYGDIIIEAIIKVEGTGELLREATSSTNYILKHQQGGTEPANNGYNVSEIYKDGVVINPITTGDVYDALSDEFHSIVIYVKGVNFTAPLINLTGRLQEFVIF